MGILSFILMKTRYNNKVVTTFSKVDWELWILVKFKQFEVLLLEDSCPL